MSILGTLVVGYVAWRIYKEHTEQNSHSSAPHKSPSSDPQGQKGGTVTANMSEGTATASFSCGADVRIEKVVGVTYDNRQSVIAGMRAGEKVFLRREPSNRYDANAIRVERADGRQIGYLSRSVAAQLAGGLDRAGGEVEGVVYRLTGGTSDFPTRGVRIRFAVPGASTDSRSHDVRPNRNVYARSRRNDWEYESDFFDEPDCDDDDWCGCADYDEGLEDMIEWAQNHQD